MKEHTNRVIFEGGKNNDFYLTLFSTMSIYDVYNKNPTNTFSYFLKEKYLYYVGTCLLLKMSFRVEGNIKSIPLSCDYSLHFVILAFTADLIN